MYLLFFYTHVEEACNVTSHGLHVIATTTRQTITSSEDIGICKLNQEHIMKKGMGGGKECKAPTHLIEISELTHAACVTKNRHIRKLVCSQEK